MTPKDLEYEALRREIEKLSEFEHSLYNILYVGVTAILAWSINTNKAFVCLLAYCIIFPSFYVMLSYNAGIFRIGAYIYVYYDEYFWEKRLHEINTNEKYHKQRYALSYRTPFIFVSIMSTILSVIITIQTYAINSIEYIVIIMLSFLLLLSFMLFVFLQKSNDEIKQVYITAFRKMKNNESIQKYCKKNICHKN